MNKWIAEFDLEDGDTMPEHMDLEYKGVKIDFHCRPMWIPCSERLPEESGRYLVTNAQWGTYHVDRDIYYVNVEGRCDGWLWDRGCIAWMPFPEPYREERTEE